MSPEQDSGGGCCIGLEASGALPNTSRYGSSGDRDRPVRAGPHSTVASDAPAVLRGLG